jgi:hypothetical protein
MQRWLLSGILLIHSTLHAQVGDVQGHIEQVVEAASQLEDADVNLEMLYETLAGYAVDPLDINAATDNELMQLHVLNEFQLASLRDYMAKYGNLFTPYELQYVHGISQEQMMIMLPFVATGSWVQRQDLSLRQMLLDGQHQVLMRVRQQLEQQQGYKPIADSLLQLNPNARYLGNPPSYYVRYRYTYRDNVQWGVTMESDAGEQFIQQGKGFDYYSAHVQLSNIGMVKTLVVGDYYAQFGQGLALWQGGNFGKSSDALSVAKRGMGVRAYTGADENNYFRGVAAAIRVKKLTASTFFSYKNIDGNIDSLDQFSTLQTTGLHRTVRELEGKDAVSEIVAGGNVSYSFSKLRLGLTGVWHKFGGSYEKDVKPYNMYELNKSENVNLGADLRWYVKKFHIFSEFGMSHNAAKAILAGCLVDVATPLQLAVLYRSYDKDYQAYYSNGFSDGGKTSNEEGFYIGMNAYPSKKVKVSVYFDAYYFPWLKYKANAPSKGYDCLMQLDYYPQQFCRMYLRVKYDSKEENFDDLRFPTKVIDEVRKVTARYNVDYRLMDGLMCQTRAEASYFKAGTFSPENGFLVFQDVRYSFPVVHPLSLTLRYAMFNTDSYNTRIYAYENDVLYAFSVPSYYGNGARWYANVHWSPHAKVELWVRMAQTYYFDRSAIGSGLTKIESNHQTDVKVQVRVKL